MKTKSIVLFDPGSIELTITGSVKKNTLPAIRETLTAWLESFDASKLETDKDFSEAAVFVKTCERAEKKIDEIRESATSGDVKKALEAIDAMQETIRQKRLEFDRAVTQRKTELKNDAVAKALQALSTAMAAYPHRRAPRNLAEQPDQRLLLAIKGKSAILKMQEALEAESAKILAEVKDYSDTFSALRGAVADLYTAAGETATESELNMLVTTHYTEAPERAKFILEQKKVARDQAALDAQKKELETAQAAPAQPEPAQPAANMTMRTMRVGATFTVVNEAVTRTRIEGIGGRDIKFVLIPQEGK